MFVRTSMKETVVRPLLILVFLVNAVIPASVLAKSPTSLPEMSNKQIQGKAALPTENLIRYPSFARPVSRMSAKPEKLASPQGIVHDATITCTTGPCSDPGPAVMLTETLVNQTDGANLGFKINCDASPCASRDIFWSASGRIFVRNDWPNPWTVSYYTSVYGSGYNGQRGQGGLDNVFCASDSWDWYDIGQYCGFSASGVIPKDKINGDPNASNHFYITISISNTAGSGNTIIIENGTVQASYDSSLINFKVLPDSVNCKSCYFGGSQGWAADPINTNTGTVSYEEKDLAIATDAGELTFKHTYISSYTSKFTSPLGYGWVHNQDIRLIFPGVNEPSFVYFKNPSGNLYQFWYAKNVTTGAEEFTPYPGFTASLVKNSGTPVTYTLRDQAQNVYTFNANGQLTSLVNSTGQGFTYTYTNGQLSQISADGGTNFLQFHYDAQNRLDWVRDHTDRYIHFYYDPNGDLDYFEDVLGQNWNYEYLNHLLTKVEEKDSHQQVERNEYYTNGKVHKQYDGKDKLVAELIYNTDGTTTVKDALGNQVTHTYDSTTATLSGNANYFGQTHKAYDANFRPKNIQDAVGNPPITLTWSDDGANLKYVKDSSGAETFIDYEDPDAPNSPTKIMDPLRHSTTYSYEDANFPTLPTRIEYPLSFDNGATFIHTDYEYYPLSSGAWAGKVKLVTDALRNKTYYTYTPLAQTETVTTGYGTSNALTTTYGYDNLGRLVKVIDPSGVITRNEYDAAGRTVITIQNVNPAEADEIQPLQNSSSSDGKTIYNIYTRYYYDARGNQIAVVDTNWVITRTYYDLANRPISVVQNLVINETPAANDNDVTVAVGTALEQVPAYSWSYPAWNVRTSTEYDDAGNVIVTHDPAGIITRTYYDKANRPELIIQNWSGTNLYGDISTAPLYNPANPDQNIRTKNFYDANGNLIATKDTLGIITRTYYDELNRPEAVIQNLFINGTDNDINAALSAVPAYSSTNPDRNVRTVTHYDANGNVIATIDARGKTTRTYYDSLNRPIVVVQNLVGKSYTDPAPPNPGLHPEDCGTETNICSFTYYDQAGNAIATVDPNGVVTRTYYDESNRARVTIQNLKGDIYTTTPPDRVTGTAQPAENLRTDISYDQLGRKDISTDPLGHITKYEYNDVGQLIKTTVNYADSGTPDQHNIVTNYSYDALGRQYKTVDTTGRVTWNRYDSLGRLTSTTQNYLVGASQNYKDPASGNQFNLITTYSYDERGNQVAVKNTKNVITRTYYDSLSRPIAVVKNLTVQDISVSFPPERSNLPGSTANVRTDTVYLGNGTVDYVLDEMGKKTDYSYDALGRLTVVQDPLLNPTSYEYDANGNRTLMTDAEGVSTKYDYDGLNRLKTVMENFNPDPNIKDNETNVLTSYTYDANGNRLSIVDGNGHPTSFSYDALNRLLTETDALGHETEHQYLMDFTLKKSQEVVIDANSQTNGKSIIYYYDELNRLEKSIIPTRTQMLPSPTMR